MVERARRLRARPSQSGLRGPRESPPGPTTWVRPKGLVERMNAGAKNPAGSGDLENDSFRLQKAVPRTKENAAVERREANALRQWACAARRQDVTLRLSALRSLTLVRGDVPSQPAKGKTITAHPALDQQGGRSFVFLLVSSPAV